MNNLYEFDAPQYLSFNYSNEDGADQFFDTLSSNVKKDISAVPSVDNGFKDGIDSVTSSSNNDNENQDPNVTNRDNHEKQQSETLCHALESLNIDSTKKRVRLFEGIDLNVKESAKTHRMTTRLDTLTNTPVLELRSRSIPKSIAISDMTDVITDEELDDSQVYPGKKRFAESPLQQQEKYIALAEKIKKFHYDTPDRYRTKSKLSVPVQQPYQPKLYLPKTPQLLARTRTRPPVHLLTQEEKEQLEVEEMMKNQFKAHPLNKKILENVSLGLKVKIEKKPTTVQQPFNLHATVPKKKEVPPLFKFKAQPVPVKILQGQVGVPPMKLIPPTSPKTPKITCPTKLKTSNTSQQLSAASSKESINKDTRRVEIKPFSFEERDKLMLKRKEETVKKILEEEKKLFNSFKANPVLPTIKKRTVCTNKMENTLAQGPPPVTPFKARPATILKRTPFFPKFPKSTNPSPAPCAPKLRTIARAEVRQEFNEKIKESERIREAMEKENELMQREEAEKEAKVLRKLAEFKAKPVPKPSSFEVHSSNKPLTDPKSPVFISGKKKPAPANEPVNTNMSKC